MLPDLDRKETPGGQRDLLVGQLAREIFARHWQPALNLQHHHLGLQADLGWGSGSRRLPRCGRHCVQTEPRQPVLQELSQLDGRRPGRALPGR